MSAPALVREASPEDAEALEALDRALALDGRGMVLDVDQIPDAERLRARIDEMRRAASAGDASVLLVDDSAGTLVGSASLRQLPPARCAHVGVLALGVHPERQRRGVGRALMHALIERAREAGLTRLELYVRADNERAIALYRSCGFEHEGTRARFVRLADGTLLDDWIMVRFL